MLVSGAWFLGPGAQCPGIGATESYEPPGKCWGLNLGLLEGQPSALSWYATSPGPRFEKSFKRIFIALILLVKTNYNILGGLAKLNICKKLDTKSPERLLGEI